jgi:hypothetical protein
MKCEEKMWKTGEYDEPGKRRKSEKKNGEREMEEREK